MADGRKLASVGKALAPTIEVLRGSGEGGGGNSGVRRGAQGQAGEICERAFCDAHRPAHPRGAFTSGVPLVTSAGATDARIGRSR